MKYDLKFDANRSSGETGKVFSDAAIQWVNASDARSSLWLETENWIIGCTEGEAPIPMWFVNPTEHAMSLVQMPGFAPITYDFAASVLAQLIEKSALDASLEEVRQLFVLRDNRNEDSHPVLNRREFFKSAAAGVLPILGAVLLSQLPIITSAKPHEPMGCDWDCTYGCKGGCGRSCSIGCTNSCSGSCLGSCKGGCDRACSLTCSGSCSGTCTGGCKNGCGSSCSYGVSGW